jgi:hypothetical protein
LLRAGVIIPPTDALAELRGVLLDGANDQAATADEI